VTAEAALDMVRSRRSRLLLVPDGGQPEQPPSPMAQPGEASPRVHHELTDEEIALDLGVP